MGIVGRALVIFLVLASSLGAVPAAAEAAPNCTLTNAGDVYCGGGAQPVRVPVTGKVVQLAASGDSTCALTEPGEVYCWPADEAAAAVPTDEGLGFDPLILISIGLALVGAGFTLVKVGQGARPRAVSRHRSAPSLSRSA
ncbi:RCC1 domain-containing protein [Actinoplanes sp. NPDC051411]|uniref:RCC1 domain-containing protein n=1 Tax=Actinoplanes sp. NPDC051411 TaxID=3155522 RepID=UPI0034249559